MIRPADLQFKSCAATVAEAMTWGSEFPEEDGVRNAIVAVTGIRDEVGDIIVPGAFKDSLERIEPKMCLGHDWNRPIGIPVAYEELMPGDPRLPKTDYRGEPWPAEAGALVARNRYMLGTEDGRNAYEHAKFFGEKTAFSIGYVPHKEHTRQGKDALGRSTRFLHKIDVHEWGPVLHGANSLARLLGKDGRPADLEGKGRYVRDSRYWGYPVGTPITATMRPRGPVALAARRKGKTPSRDVGVTAAKPIAGSPGERVKPNDAVREDAQAGLFAAPKAERLAAPKAKGKEVEYLTALRDQFLDENSALQASPERGKRPDPSQMLTDDGEPLLSKFLEEGLTPAELEEDLRDLPFEYSGDRATHVEARQEEIDDFVDDVLDDYRALYNRALRGQNREQRASEPKKPSQSDWPSTTSVASMRKAEAAKRALAMSDEELRAHDEELTSRATELGKDGQVSPAHQAIKDEIAKRAEGERSAESPSTPEGERSAEAPESPEAPPRQGEPQEEAPVAQEEAPVAQEEAPVAQEEAPVAQDGLDEAPEAEQAPGAEQSAEPTAAPQAAEEPVLIGEDGGRQPGFAIPGPNEEQQTPGGTAPATAEEPAPEDTAQQPDTPAINGVPMVAEDDNDELTPESYSLTLANGDVLEVRRYGEDYADDPAKPWYASVHDFQTNEVRELGGHASAEEATAAIAEGYDGDLTPGQRDGTPLEGEAPVEPGQGSVEADTQADAEKPKDTALIAAEEVAEATEVTDGALGVTEAADGEFEVDADIADRQDRVAFMLSIIETGPLELTYEPDDYVRGARADVLAELALQQHLERRERQRVAAPATVPGETTTPDGAEAQQRNTDPAAPRPRPGVAGAAEDLADALESGTPDRVDAARARLQASLNRSRADTEQVQALRALMDGGTDPTPEGLRGIAEAIRTETRARRNEQARGRRRARRFERERLRSLLGQIEGEMTRRGLKFDPAADDGDVVVPAGTWEHRTDRADRSGAVADTWTVHGAGWSAVVQDRSAGDSRTVSYSWSATGPGGVTLTGEGRAETPEAARGIVEISLSTQRAQGNVPLDAALPPVTVSSDPAAAQAEVDSSLQHMRELAALPDQSLNPLTGLPNPLAPPRPAPPPAVRVFDKPEDVLTHLSSIPNPTRASQRAAENFLWDTLELSPGGGLGVVKSKDGGNYIVHTGSGGYVHVDPSLGKSAPVLTRYMVALENATDTRGRRVNWGEPDPAALKADISRWEGDGGKKGLDALMRTAARDLAFEELRKGKWESPILKTKPLTSPSPTNALNGDKLKADHYTLKGMIESRRGRTGLDKIDKETARQITGARNLERFGAPDAAAVLLRRRAAELRDELGKPEADLRGATLLDDIADDYLVAYSPQRSPLTRLTDLTPNETVVLEAPGAEERRLRVLTRTRSEADGSYTRVLDESTGEEHLLHLHGDRLDLLATSGHEGDESRLVVQWNVGMPGPNDTGTPEKTGHRPPEAEVIPQEVLDAAARLLPESPAERDLRRAAGGGGRAPARTSARAPRRTAANPPEVRAVPGEQNLARVQGGIQRGWNGDVEFADTALEGGFSSLDEVREFLDSLPKDDGSGRRDPYGFLRDQFDPREATFKSMTLSPGGHFIVSDRGDVVHVRTGLTVWGAVSSLTTSAAGRDVSGYSKAVSMAIADNLERATSNGTQFDWDFTDQNKTRERMQSFGVERMIGAARMGILRGNAQQQKTPSVKEVELLQGATKDFFPSFPNPEAFDYRELLNSYFRYQMVGGKQNYQLSDKVAPARSAAETKLAREVSRELFLVSAMVRVAPLDAVRRLDMLAQRWDGKTIETEKGNHDPAGDARKLLKQITDASDPAKRKAPETESDKEADVIPATV